MDSNKQNLAKFIDFSNRFDRLRTDLITDILRMVKDGKKVYLLAISGALVEDIHDWGVSLINNETGGIIWEHMTLDSMLQLHMSLMA